MKERPFIRVQVSVSPEWDMPSESTADRITRSQSEQRFAALAHDLEKWLASRLNEMSAEDLATASCRLFLEKMEKR